MGWEAFLSLFVVCCIGAASPGPSLVVIMRHSRLGRRQGVVAALGHGVAVLIYALLVVFGLYSVLTAFPKLIPMMQLVGAIWLLKIAYGLIFSSSDSVQEPSVKANHLGAGIDGFAIAFFNPKIALFMLALFSQWLYAGQPLAEKLVMGLIAGGVDALWYVLVAVCFSHQLATKLLATRWVDHCLALLLTAVSLVVVLRFLLGY